VLYERGRGVPVDTTEALAWYRKAASQDYALAQFNLAVALTKGEGTRQDFFDAALWYRRAGAQGIIPAMVNLAILYEGGQGVEASPLDAYAWYKAAADRGSEPARRRAGELFATFAPSDQTRADMVAADVAASIGASNSARHGSEETGPVSTPASGKDTPVLVPGFGPGSPGARPQKGGTGATDEP
jgi:TPR repeat protein